MDFKSILEYHKIVWRSVYAKTKYDLFGDIKNLVGDLVIAIASGLLYAIWSYVRQDTTIDWFGITLAVIGGFLIWGFVVFIYNLLWKVPARLFNEQEQEANKYNLNKIEIIEHTFRDKDLLVGYGINLENRKTTDLHNVAIELIYLEVDHKVVYKTPTRNYVEFTRHRFPEFTTSQYDGNTFTLNKSQKIKIIFIDHYPKQNNHEYRVVYCIPDHNEFKTKTIPIQSQVRCEFIIYAKVQYQPQPLDGDMNYNFEFRFVNNKPSFSFNKGKLGHYIHESEDE